MLKTVLIVVLVLLVCLLYRTQENYGGKVKKIRKIPFNECARICSTYYESCIRDGRGEDAGFCHERFGQNGTCVKECYYSNYHRM